MKRFALFVDAGYFFAGGAEVAFDDKLSRNQYQIADIPRCIAELQELASQACDGHELLRVYWYDASPATGLTREQLAIGNQPGTKLRLGVLNNFGEQKGVDSLIVTDLIELARNSAITDAVLLSGDEDVRIGVELAQSFGLRVHLIGIGNSDRNVSRLLRMESDSFTTIDESWCTDTFVRIGPEAEVGVAGEPVGRVDVDFEAGLDLETAAQRVTDQLLHKINEQALNELAEVIASAGAYAQIPSEYDGKLIAATASALGGISLTAEEKKTVRALFMRRVTDGASPR